MYFYYVYLYEFFFFFIEWLTEKYDPNLHIRCVNYVTLVVGLKDMFDLWVPYGVPIGPL